MPALQARYIALGESARRARERRLLGNDVSRLPASPLASSLAPECGLGPHKFAGCKVGWTIAGDDGQRRYGLFCET
jgi:hypothetical protein